MRLGRRCAQLALAGLMCLGASAQAQAPAPPTLVVKDGQSATEIALDQVPPGTTIAQFLLALHRLNPQAFAQGDLNRLLAQARLRLPSAEEANQVPLAQAQAQLAQLSQGPQVAAPPAQPGPEPAAPASAEATAPAAPAPSAAITATPAPAAEPAPGAGVFAAIAVLLAAGLLWWLRSGRRQPQAAAPSAQADPERLAQGRFQPVLPQDKPAVPPPQAAPPTLPKPALFDLDLSLDGTAPPLNLPTAKPGPQAGLGPLPSLDLGSAPPPRARAPGPLDLGGLSLDLDAPAPPKDKP